MLTNEDIQRIIEANKIIFPSKEEFDDFRQEIKKDFSDLKMCFTW